MGDLVKIGLEVEGLDEGVEVSSVTWDGVRVTSPHTPLNGTFRPTAKDELSIIAKVTLKAPDGDTVSTATPLASEPTKVNVYNKPEITEITSNKTYTFVNDKPFYITVSIKKDPEIKISSDSITWQSDYVTDTSISDDNLKITGQFDPSQANEGEVEVWAEIKFMAPDENVLITLPESEPESSQKTKIIVLPNPVEEVTDKDFVKEPFEDEGEGYQSKIIAYEGQDGVTFNYSVETPDNRYNWEYKWVLDDGTEFEIESSGVDVTYTTELTEGTHSVKLIAQAFNPDPNLDDDHKEAWGEPIECTLSPITIYPAPTYEKVNMHETNSTTNDIYAIFVDETLDATTLYKKTGGYPDGWKPKLYVDETEQPGMTFKPTNGGTYDIKLVVNNVAIPIGENEIWKTDTTTYTLHVYDKPVWDATDIDTKFNTDETVLNVETGDTLDITAKLTKGNAKWWNVKCSYNDEAESFTETETSNERTYKHIFELTGEEPQEIPLEINISYDYETTYLLEGQKKVIDDHIKSLPNSIERTIVVWNKITAEVAELNVQTEGTYNGKYVLETREGDNDDQTITINLVGGDKAKWTVKLESGNETEGDPSWNDAKDTYTYTIPGNNLTANDSKEKAYGYSFTATYQDGQTQRDTTFNLSIIVWPEPKITKQTLALYNPNKNPNKDVSYIEKSGKYTVDCYQNDTLQMTVTTSGGKTGELWKYNTSMMNSEARETIPAKGITFNTTGIIKFKFFNYLTNSNGTKEKEVKSVDVVVNPRKETPDYDLTLPDVDGTDRNPDIWSATNRVDLYAGGTHTAEFSINPKLGHEGNESGWDYIWKLNEDQQSQESAWSYTAKTSSNEDYEDKDISVNIVNKIPGDGTSQIGDNIGLDSTKVYKVRVWHKAEFPDKYSLIDPQNSFYEGGNNVYDTKSIREGNKLVAKIEGIQYGYTGTNSNGGYRYAWEGQGSKNQSSWDAIVTNTAQDGKLGSSKETYGLEVNNLGPRGTIWDSKDYEDCEVTIFNRPKTPTKLEKKGNGTSHTMIIEYADISDEELIIRGDYFINFWYTNPNGDTEIASKQQQTIGDIRWATGYANAEQMNNAFVYANWLDATNGVLITSGKRTLTGVDEDWDMSNYGLSPKQITQIRALTRAGNGDFYNIINLEDYDDIDLTDGEIRVYNLNGMMVGTSTDNLPSGIYVVHYLQNGSKRTKKLSVK